MIPRHRTALKRTALSRPAKCALRDGLITAETSVLDYGCGHGGGVELLGTQGIACTGWDPVYFPERPVEEADVVQLGYVINVIEDLREHRDADAQLGALPAAAGGRRPGEGRGRRAGRRLRGRRARRRGATPRGGATCRPGAVRQRRRAERPRGGGATVRPVRTPPPAGGTALPGLKSAGAAPPSPSFAWRSKQRAGGHPRREEAGGLEDRLTLGHLL